MAEFYRESRDEQYEKNIYEFYNDLAFMKDKSAFDLEKQQTELENERRFG